MRKCNTQNLYKNYTQTHSFCLLHQVLSSTTISSLLDKYCETSFQTDLLRATRPGIRKMKLDAEAIQYHSIIYFTHSLPSQ